MRIAQLAVLRFFTLLFLLPGLAGLLVAAMISTHYLDSMPKDPVIAEGRVVPREIHGIVVYQTAKEDRRLSVVEYSSVGIFIIGLSLGLVYLEKWGTLQGRYAEEERELLEYYRG